MQEILFVKSMNQSDIYPGPNFYYRIDCYLQNLYLVDSSNRRDIFFLKEEGFLIRAIISEPDSSYPINDRAKITEINELK
jgi:hypothetical protein